MNDDDIRKIIDDAEGYNETREEPLLQGLYDFYSRRMRVAAIAVWVNGLIGMAIAAVTAVSFFRADRVRDEIMYATLFLVGMGWLMFAKIVAAVFLVDHRLRRDIKRLEIRLSDAGDTGRHQPRP